ncbi:unnamed protein product [Mytilus coruscus]|uniref:Uncharacterized protein n=1 Tax=Mytilus coruscus TaxID=42192 RepID=A0A6J8C6R5_MYTCO|nr:unnamed protein product [Mytilus coruscus]
MCNNLVSHTCPSTCIILKRMSWVSKTPNSLSEFSRCNRKYGCTFDLNAPEGRKTKDSTSVVIGCVVILMLILSVTVLLVLWKTDGSIIFIRMNINRALSFFQCHSNTFEITTEDNSYASIRVSAVEDNYRPAMQTHSIQLLRQAITNQQYSFREGNHTSTRSNLDIYSVATPLHNTSSLDGEVIICNTSCVNPERVVPTLSDPSQENEEVTRQENEGVIHCDNYSFLVTVEESSNELNKDSTC